MATSREGAYHDPVDADVQGFNSEKRTFTMDSSKSGREQMAQQLNQLMQTQRRDTELKQAQKVDKERMDGIPKMINLAKIEEKRPKN